MVEVLAPLLLFNCLLQVLDQLLFFGGRKPMVFGHVCVTDRDYWGLVCRQLLLLATRIEVWIDLLLTAI